MKEDLSEYQSGKERLSSFFGLSYARWLTIPRVLMQQMPDEWQYRAAILFEEFSDEFSGDWSDGKDLYVNAKENGKYTPLPEWLGNYRYPDLEKIEQIRKGS